MDYHGRATTHLNPNTYSVTAVIDADGYRLNVGIILCNAEGRLFWAKRIGQPSWQFPQGGIKADESPEQAMFRELAEEVGLRPEHVQIIGSTRGWLRYRLPKRLIRENCSKVCIGQKQIWFLLRMRCDEAEVKLDRSEQPEFDHWQWVDYWYPLRAVVSFKRHVYWQALHELAPLLATMPATAKQRPTLCVCADPPRPYQPTPSAQHRCCNQQNPVITRMVVTTRHCLETAQLEAASVSEPAAHSPPRSSTRPRWPRR